MPPGWEAHPVGLEELALAYLREPGAAALPGPARDSDAELSAASQMSALTMPVHPEQEADCGRCRGGGWPGSPGGSTASRSTGVAVLLGGLAAYVWVVGRQLHHAYAAAITCHPASSAWLRRR